MKNEILKFIRSFLAFAVVALFLYVVLLCLWGEFFPSVLSKNLNYKRGAYGHMYTRIKEARATKNVDILFLGSSHTYRGFDTRIFSKAGYKCFNFGSSAQTPMQTKVLLERYLDGLNPKMVIYEVYPATFTIDGVESSVDIFANDTIDERSFKLALKQNNIKVYNTLVYAFYRQLFNRNKNFTEDPVKEGDLYVKGGFVESTIKHFKPVKYDSTRWVFSEEQFKAFDTIISDLKKRNIKVLLVQSPITRCYYNSVRNNEEFDKRMASYSVYHNYNNTMQLNDSLNFYDYNHLNQHGVEVFNKKLLEMVPGNM